MRMTQRSTQRRYPEVIFGLDTMEYLREALPHIRSDILKIMTIYQAEGYDGVTTDMVRFKMGDTKFVVNLTEVLREMANDGEIVQSEEKTEDNRWIWHLP